LDKQLMSKEKKEEQQEKEEKKEKYVNKPGGRK
jgi:hypothetical protein